MNNFNGLLNDHNNASVALTEVIERLDKVEEEIFSIRNHME